MNEMDTIIRRDLLFDFYGDLLTEHQKRIYEEVVFNDYSMSEVAGDEGISRQGVSDMIRRSSHMLESYEKKLGLVKRFLQIKDLVGEVRSKLAECRSETGEKKLDDIYEVLDRLEEIL